MKPVFALLLALAFTANAETITDRAAGRLTSIDAKASKLILARLLGGETFASLAREYSSSR